MTQLQARRNAADVELPAGLSPTGKLVYLYLSVRGSASVDDLKTALGIPQIRLYPTLACLRGEGLVERDADVYAVTG